MLLALGVDDRSLAERRGRDEITDAHPLLLRGFNDFLRLFLRVIRQDGLSVNDAHSTAHHGILLAHVQILAK